jgi:hypothetical protein
MENVAASEFLGLADLLEANDAGIVHTRGQVLGRIHIREALELINEGARLYE